MASRPLRQLGIRAAHLADDDVDERVQSTGSVKPSFLPWRIARRMILRST